MNRRSFLAALAALPLVGRLVPKAPYVATSALEQVAMDRAETLTIDGVKIAQGDYLFFKDDLVHGYANGWYIVAYAHDSATPFILERSR